MTQTKIGFIGQGWIGKNLADHFEERGFETVRYAKEEPYVQNKSAIAECDIVFIAVPTPTTPSGFDDSLVRAVLPLVGEGKTAVIKSTVVPGTTSALQAQFPNRIVVHSPEFLREAQVRQDIDSPDRTIIGIPSAHMGEEAFVHAVKRLQAILPHAPYVSVCTSEEAELTKYASNNFLFMKVVFMNLLYDLAGKYGAKWDILRDNMKADPRIGASHMEPMHQYAHMSDGQGRGAGGHCFIKDFAAFREMYEREFPEDTEALALLAALERKNLKLLMDSGKDIDLVRAVYG